MRIGFDGSCLSNRRGFGRFANRLLSAFVRRAVGHEVVVVIDEPSAATVELPEGAVARIVGVRDAPSASASARGRRRLGDMLAMSRSVAAARLDLMYSPATYTFYPVWGVPRLVVDTLGTRPKIAPCP